MKKSPGDMLSWFLSYLSRQQTISNSHFDLPFLSNSRSNVYAHLHKWVVSQRESLAMEHHRLPLPSRHLHPLGSRPARQRYCRGRDCSTRQYRKCAVYVGGSEDVANRRASVLSRVRVREARMWLDG
jgi:hypothetical protein